MSSPWEGSVEDRLADIEGRLSRLEGEPVPPHIPPPTSDSGMVDIPFTTPPLLYNKGSWTGTDIITESSIDEDGALHVTIGQKAQSRERVVRKDWGFQDPKLEPGRGGFLREPYGVPRRYEVTVTLPEPYDNRAEMTNLFQAHTDSTVDPPLWSFFVWTNTTRWRVNGPNGERQDYHIEDTRPGDTYRLVVEALWSAGQDGRIQIWQDGESVVSLSGSNCKAGKPPYIMVGPYAPSAKKAFINTFIFRRLRIGNG